MNISHSPLFAFEFSIRGLRYVLYIYLFFFFFFFFFSVFSFFKGLIFLLFFFFGARRFVNRRFHEQQQQQRVRKRTNVCCFERFALEHRLRRKLKQVKSFRKVHCLTTCLFLIYCHFPMFSSFFFFFFFFFFPFPFFF